MNKLLFLVLFSTITYVYSQQTNTTNIRKNKQCKPCICQTNITEVNNECKRSLMTLYIDPQHVKNVDRQYTSDSIFGGDGTTTTIIYGWKVLKNNYTGCATAFELNDNDAIFINKDGLYQIYFNIVIHDLTGRWSFGLYKDSRELLVKCIETQQLSHLINPPPNSQLPQLHSTSHGVFVSCNAQIIVQLPAKSKLFLKDMYGSRTFLTQAQFSYLQILEL